MAKFNVDGVQNVEVSKKFPCQKPLSQQLQIMEQYTSTHRLHAGSSKEVRELECLKVLYPKLFRTIEDADLIAGRIDFLPIGFGCVTSLGGVGHYCVFNKLRELQRQLDSQQEKDRVDQLYNYWLENDVKTIYCNEVLTDDTIGRFIDCDYALIATARLSGMMLDYPKLFDYGIDGLRDLVNENLKADPKNEFLQASLGSLSLFSFCADSLREILSAQCASASPERRAQLELMIASLLHVAHKKPETFHQALQLFWLYALLAGVINYGRLDDFLGPYLVRDLESGRIDQDQAYQYLASLWTLIENRRTTVNGRIIVGGRGRKNPKEADVFLHIAMKVVKNFRYVEPQFTLRMDKSTSKEIWDEAMDAIGAGATYPTIYNDEVNVPALMHAMRVDQKTAEQYVPFGCTEFVIQGQSTGTPNVCMNVLKMLTITLNQGIDPFDGKSRSGPVKIKALEEFASFEDFYQTYKELLDHYMDLSIDAQMKSYEVMAKQVSFLFSSILIDDCISRGKAILDGGVRYLGGTNEIYGIINASDALWAIKDLVFDKKIYTLSQLQSAAMDNFAGNEELRRQLWDCDKYGNDLDTADNMALDLYHHIAQGVRDRGIAAGMQYYLIVISNNQLNTEWGRTTAASLDGRLRGQYMNPANNPQGGADKSGPSAMLNSVAKFEAKYHGGSVQNIKFTPEFFNKNREMITVLFKTYFDRGGCHLMVTVVGRDVLEDAMKHPEKYSSLIVRVSGFSAIFVNLDKEVQQELLSRVLYG